MKICELIRPEIEHILAEGNFTEDEKELFLKRTKDLPLEECAEQMNVSVSTVKRLNKRIKNKIGRIYH